MSSDDWEAKLEDHIMEELAKDIRDELDFEIMADMLIESGWFVIKLPYALDLIQRNQIDRWLVEQRISQNGFYSRGNAWLFKSKDDAIMFRLTWE